MSSLYTFVCVLPPVGHVRFQFLEFSTALTLTLRLDLSTALTLTLRVESLKPSTALTLTLSVDVESHAHALSTRVEEHLGLLGSNMKQGFLQFITNYSKSM